jgi:hypothetical protein
MLALRNQVCNATAAAPPPLNTTDDWAFRSYGFYNYSNLNNDGSEVPGTSPGSDPNSGAALRVSYSKNQTGCSGPPSSNTPTALSFTGDYNNTGLSQCQAIFQNVVTQCEYEAWLIKYNLTLS